MYVLGFFLILFAKTPSVSALDSLPDTNEVHEAITNVAAAVAPSIGTIERSGLYFYHYTRRGRLNQGLDVYLRRVFGTSGDPADEKYASEGLYVAFDPLISRDYGGTPLELALFRIELARGTRFLRLLHLPSHLDRKSESTLKDICPSYEDLPGFLLYGGNPPEKLKSNSVAAPAGTIMAGGGPSWKACRELRARIFERLDVRPLLWAYMAVEFSVCPERQHLGGEADFIIVDPGAISSSGIKVITASSPVDDEIALIDQMFHEHPIYGFNSLFGVAEPSSQSEQLSQYMHEHLVGCGEAGSDFRFFDEGRR